MITYQNTKKICNEIWSGLRPHEIQQYIDNYRAYLKKRDLFEEEMAYVEEFCTANQSFLVEGLPFEVEDPRLYVKLRSHFAWPNFNKFFTFIEGTSLDSKAPVTVPAEEEKKPEIRETIIAEEDENHLAVSLGNLMSQFNKK
jgi:hypothetical protein